MHLFTISIWETVHPQFNDSLRIHFNEGRGYQTIWTIKTYEFENTRSNANKCCEHWEKKRKQYIRQIIYTSQGHLSAKITPEIDFAVEPVVQYHFPVVDVTFAEDSK